VAKIQLKLKPFFKRESILLRGQYRRLLTLKKGIRNDTAPSNELSTILSKGADHWLINTGETREKGIGYKAFRSGMKVYAMKNRHSGNRVYMGVKGGHKGRKRGVHRPRDEKRIVNYGKGPPYHDLYTWHNKGGDPTAMYNGTERYSGIFQKWPVGSKFPDRLGMAVRKEVKKHLKKEIRRAF
jgi:hypothetical protein